MAIAAGARFNYYEVISQLGVGGMGEVYLARDTRLDRKVALKLLPATFTQDVARVRRFVQEAKAASALNHPNILTIHEIGEVEGAHFIATEFIDGQTLRARLAGERLLLATALDLAIQTASALVAAHEAGIVHRDIKPENVMLRRDGIVKVLDFGLAKLTEQRPATVDSEAPTIAKVNTDPGTVLGTASYMSPEQARGQEVDARSDIFSLGVMLYEMLAGRAPFSGLNAIEVLGAILNQEPALLRQHVPEAPVELQRIIGKALRKDREQRYQHAKDLLLDLKDLKQELEFEAKLKGVQAFGVAPSGGSARPSTQPPEGATPTTRPAEVATKEVESARATSSAEIILAEFKRHKLGVAIGLAVLLACLMLLGYSLYRFAQPKQSVARFQNIKFSPLTSLGNVGSASISPDGKFISYVQTEAGKNSLWTKVIATSSVVQVVPPTEATLSELKFSLDGNYVYYSKEEALWNYSLYQIPVFGGTPKQLQARMYFPGVALAPDGKQFTFLRRSVDGATYQLIVVNTDGSGERILTTRPHREGLARHVWSPDGKLIAFLGVSQPGRAQHQAVFGVVVASGEVKPIFEPGLNMRVGGNLAWLKDGSGLILVAAEQNANHSQIWQVSYPGGQLRRITNDLASYNSVSLTADNSALVATQTERFSTLWLTQPGSSSHPQQLTVRGNHLDGTRGVRWTPDGRIVYSSRVGSNFDLWLRNIDGSEIRQLTDDSDAEISLAVSPAGRYFVFISNRSGLPTLWRANMDGSNPKQLTTLESLGQPDFSPDGRWVIFDGRNPVYRKIHKVSIEGGESVLLLDQNAFIPAVSPDGKLIACFSFDNQFSQRSLIIIPFEGGEPLKTLDDKTSNIIISSPLRWSPDGRALLYVDRRQGAANLWQLPLDGGAPQPVTHFNDAKPERIWDFDLARDGKQLVIARGGQSADVVLISEVK